MHPVLSRWYNARDLLFFLYGCLLARFHETDEGQDLDWAIAVARQVLDYFPFVPPDRWSSLSNLAYSRYKRYERWGDAADLERAIMLWREAVTLCPRDSDHLSSLLNSLATALSLRNGLSGRNDDLNEIIETQQLFLSITSEEHPTRFRMLNDHANALVTRFDENGDMEDLEKSIRLHRDALSLAPGEHPYQATMLSNFGGVLLTRFRHKGMVDDLNKSIELHRKALDLRPEGCPERSDSLNNLGIALDVRFAHTGKVEDLDESIEMLRDALSLRPQGHPNRSSSLNNLSGALKSRFKQYGREDDLNESIQLLRDALTLWPEGHRLRSSALSDVGKSLLSRFEATEWMDDLTESIQLHRDSLALQQNGHPDRPLSLESLANAMWTRFEQDGRVEDLDEAICLHRATLALRPEGHPSRPLSLYNLGGVLQARFRHSGKLEDVDESIQLHLDALSYCPEGHPDRSSSLNVLAGALLLRAARDNDINRLDGALMHLHESLALLPKEHPDCSMVMFNISSTLYTRFKIARCANDYDESMRFSKQAVTHQFSNLLRRLRFAYLWTTMARSHDHISTLEAYTTALALLQRVFTIRPTLPTCHNFLAEKEDYRSLGVDAASYAIEKGDFPAAVELLEQGRALLWSQLRGFRTPLDELMRANKPLADRFKEVSCHLESLMTSSESSTNGNVTPGIPQNRPSFHTMMERVRTLLGEQENVVNEIRKVPGFENFLRPVSFEKLQEAASEGPVIIVNYSQFRCDALVLLSRKDEPCINVPLDENWFSDAVHLLVDLVRGRFNQGVHSPAYDETLKRTMSVLWDRVASKVISKLRELGIEEGSRIWWCPTSRMTWFPFHAAGPYQNVDGETRYLLDDYISSYTPTLMSLIVARSGLRSGGEKFLFVGDNRLESVIKELYAIRKWHHIDKRLLDERASGDSVLKALRKAEWVHFACHGKFEIIEPFKSSLALPGGPLTLLDIARAHLPNAQFAFLSACHTAEPALSHAMDEILNLAAAIQFCGFRSVVGTMWQFLDRDGPLLAEAVYAHLMTDAKDEQFRLKYAAAAVRRAALFLKLQKDWTDDGRIVDIATERWVNLVHIGI